MLFGCVGSLPVALCLCSYASTFISFCAVCVCVWSEFSDYDNQNECIFFPCSNFSIHSLCNKHGSLKAWQKHKIATLSTFPDSIFAFLESIWQTTNQCCYNSKQIQLFDYLSLQLSKFSFSVKITFLEILLERSIFSWSLYRSEWHNLFRQMALVSAWVSLPMPGSLHFRLA